MERQVHFLGGQIPERHLQRFMEGQRESALVAAAGAADAVDEAGGRLAIETGPDFGEEDALDLGFVGEREKQGLDEAQADRTGICDQFQRRDIHVVGAHLAVADDAIAGELEAGDAKIDDAHADGL
jgi:hypothetical protein